MKYAKHIHVLHLLSTIPTTYVDVRLELQPPQWLQEVVDAFDHMFEYIHANWAEPNSAMKKGGDQVYNYQPISTPGGIGEIYDCRLMLRMSADEFEAKLSSLPPYFSEVIFPIAVARYMIRDLRLMIDHRKSKMFMDFHRRYGRIILSGIY